MQKLRHLDLLMVAAWSVQMGPDSAIAFDEPVDILLPNPVSFIVQKLLIHDKRKSGKKAQDVLYIHDTLELFGGSLDELRALWVDQIRPSMAARTARQAIESGKRPLRSGDGHDSRSSAHPAGLAG